MIRGITDNDLITKALKGDQSSYTALYNSHHSRVRNVLIRMCHNEEDVEDLVQLTFMSAFRALPRFHNKSSFATWLHRIAINHFLMSIRPQKRNKLNFISLDFLDKEEEIFPPPLVIRDGELESIPLRDAITKGLARLPPGQKTILHFCLLGYSAGEIAEEVGCSVGNVKSQLFRARLRLQAKTGMIAQA